MTEDITTDFPPTSFVVNQKMAADLVLELSRARDIYDATPQADESEANWRNSAINALEATLYFLNASGVHSRLLAPLNSLYFALFDISDGRSNGMLERVDKGHNRSHQPLEHEHRVAQAAAYIEFAICAEGRGGLKTAIETMARSLGVSPTTMAEKRKNIAKGRSISPIAYDYYYFLVQRKNRLSPAMLKFHMEHLLSLVRNSKSPLKKSS